MIGKITKGRRIGDIASYLHGPGDNNEHVYNGKQGGMVIGGNLSREGTMSPKGWAADMWAYAKHSDAKKPIWQVSLRNTDGDRILSDAEWAEAGEIMAEDMGFSDRPWVMVRHAEDHVHLVMCRVDETGQLWRDRDEKGRGNDYARVMKATTKLERRFGLTEVPLPQPYAEAQDTAGHKITHAEHKKAQRTGETPTRVRIAERAREAAEEAKQAGGIATFERQLESLGVQYRQTTTKAGKIRGYAFALPDHVDNNGELIYYPASKLDKSLSWAELGPALEQAPDVLECSISRLSYSKQIDEAEEAVELEPLPKKGRLTRQSKHDNNVAEVRERNDQAIEQAQRNAIEQQRLVAIAQQAPRIDRNLDEQWEKRFKRAGKSRDERLQLTAAEQAADQAKHDAIKRDMDAKRAAREAPMQAWERQQQRQRQRLKDDFKKMTEPTTPSSNSPSRDRELGE